MAFKPPPVDPAHAPIPARAINKYGMNKGNIDCNDASYHLVVIKKIEWKKENINLNN